MFENALSLHVGKNGKIDPVDPDQSQNPIDLYLGHTQSTYKISQKWVHNF